MIRTNPHSYLNAQYEVYDKDKIVALAIVDNGTIRQLNIENNLQEDYKGQTLYALLYKICDEANMANANLSIMIPEIKTQKFKRFLERFGFAETHKNIFKRISGIPLPPSLIY